ncbi:amidophosphoribosyltransferase, partial [bacterium]|nr:amidophosphoribosyltransferase [bacterium]
MTHDEARFAGPIWHDPDDDHMHDECGIVGVFGHPEASTFAYLGLHALQHRGQESAGIVSHDGNVSFAHRAMGLVNENFGDPKVLKQLPGHAAIGQVRYSTAGGSRLKNAQPIAMDYTRGALALAHNGNFVNAFSMRAKLESEGSIFQSDSDTEVVAHLIAKGEGGPEERIVAALGQMRGAYSMVFLTENRLVAARDPRGWRPLILGQYEGAWIVASETCAFDLIGAEYLREIAPGEVLVIDKDGVRSSMPFPKAEPRLCVFEFVYFARPDSRIFNQDVHAIRQAFGRELAREHPADADLVMAVPDSGLPAT